MKAYMWNLPEDVRVVWKLFCKMKMCFLFLSENMAQSYFFLFSAIHNRYISITAWYNIITAISTWT